MSKKVYLIFGVVLIVFGTWIIINFINTSTQDEAKNEIDEQIVEQNAITREEALEMIKNFEDDDGDIEYDFVTHGDTNSNQYKIEKRHPETGIVERFYTVDLENGIVTQIDGVFE